MDLTYRHDIVMANLFFKGGFKSKLGRSRVTVYLYFFDILSRVNIDGRCRDDGRFDALRLKTSASNRPETYDVLTQNRAVGRSKGAKFKGAPENSSK